ncbi:hypothetical protein DSCW_01230 [Desulfosarcina widdelii]|uniref:HTH cro/C1-type domain-containing protein n=1 Tax=Desulfosarcina widdelii TaxID=947919 RepID=A0A5K7YTN3_9BACT|nr:helix-turn-helix transcriptional regulator [Desulfosarcina widdelii]BBO72706.1 hypothetical protein DSCW_01230 [Desulfosarcina widdelii]
MDFNALKKRFGIRLKKLRLDRGLRQEDLEKWGFSYRHYGRLERGLVNPTLETMVKLCQVFEITLPEMFKFLDSKQSPTEDQEAVLLSLNRILQDGNEDKIRKLKIFLQEIL